MTILEGMACGKFICATPVGGVPELIGRADDACLLRDDDAAVERLTTVQAGFDSVSNRELARRFDIRVHVERLLDLYGISR